MPVLAPILLLAAAAAPRDPARPWLSPALLPAIASPEPTTVVLELDPAAPPVEGLSVEAGGVRWVQVEVPGAGIPSLGAIPGLRRARPPRLATPKDAVVTERIDDVVDLGPWRDAGIAGRGVHVAVVDAGFEGYEDLLGSELPEVVDMHVEGGVGTTAHGTAMAEVIHDFAPEAPLLLWQVCTDVEFLAATEALAGEGVDVVNCALGFDNVWHADGTSPFARAVDDLVAATGATWVQAAGNENGRYLTGPLTDADGDGWVEIAGVEGAEAWGGEGARVSLRWSEEMDDARTDIDLVLLGEDGEECARSTEAQDGPGSAPFEVADCGDEAVVAFPVVEPGTDPSGLEGYLWASHGLVFEHSEERSLTLPADAFSALSVGACRLSTGTAPSYSSRGPTEDGRVAPDLCAPDVASTASFGQFEGTSAATPHVAGMAALVIDGEHPLGPEEVERRLIEATTALGDPGPDNTFGHGALTMGPPLPCGCRTPASRGGAALGFLGFLAGRRRTSRGPSGALRGGG